MPIMPVNLMTAFVENCTLKTFVSILHHLSFKIFFLPHILFENSYTEKQLSWGKKKMCPTKQFY